MNSQPAGTFLLLDLPPELRLIIYDHLTVTTRHCTLKHPMCDVDGSSMRDTAITLAIHSLPLAVLATCKLIQNEATPILTRKLEQLQKVPMRMMVDSPLLGFMFGRHGLLNKTVPHHLERIRADGTRIVVDEKQVRRAIEIFRNRSTRVLKTPMDIEQLCTFVRECALYLHHHKPSSTQIAITRHPGQDIEHLCRNFLNTISWMHSWETIFPLPIGFMVRADICDNFNDPHTRAEDEGPVRRRIREAFTIFSDKTFKIEDVPDREFQRVWGEGVHNNIE